MFSVNVARKQGFCSILIMLAEFAQNLDISLFFPPQEVKQTALTFNLVLSSKYCCLAVSNEIKRKKERKTPNLYEFVL